MQSMYLQERVRDPLGCFFLSTLRALAMNPEAVFTKFETWTDVELIT